MKFPRARLVSGLFLSLGLFLLLNASWPILSYEFSSSRFEKNDLLSPQVVEGLVLGSAIQNSTSAATWFVGDPALPAIQSKVQYYNITIPKLGIKGATVEIGGDDLKKNLIQYKGTALPGQPGNAVIFGHSALPQFFSPKSYLTLFSKLPSLKKGDDILVDYDGISYKYRIEEMFEVGPTDIQVLAQSFDDSYVTLVTCVPPGTLLRRLIVKARITT